MPIEIYLGQIGRRANLEAAEWFYGREVNEGSYKIGGEYFNVFVALRCGTRGA